jgi:hypothetical protein
MPAEEMAECWTNASSALGCSAAGRAKTQASAARAAWAWMASVPLGDGTEGAACTAAARARGKRSRLR